MIWNRIPLVCSCCVLGRRSRNPSGKRSRNPPNPSRFPLPARPSPFPSPPAGHPSTSTRTSLLLPHFQIPANLHPHVLYLLPPPLAISLQPPHLRVEGNHPPASSSTRRAPIPPAGLLDSTPRLLCFFLLQTPADRRLLALASLLQPSALPRQPLASPIRSNTNRRLQPSTAGRPLASTRCPAAPPHRRTPSRLPLKLFYLLIHLSSNPGVPPAFWTAPPSKTVLAARLIQTGLTGFVSDRANGVPPRSSSHPLHPRCLLSHLACWTTPGNLCNLAASPGLPWCQNRSRSSGDLPRLLLLLGFLLLLGLGVVFPTPTRIQF